MERCLAGLFPAFLMLSAFSHSAAATTIDLGTFAPDTMREGVVENLVAGITNFDDVFSFGLTASTPSLTGTLVAEESGELGEILFLTIDLFNAAQPGQSLGTFDGLPDPDFFYFNLAAGDYFLRVHGDTFPGGGVYDYTIKNGNPAVVPIPHALLLFATALGGLGFAGYRRCRPA